MIIVRDTDTSQKRVAQILNRLSLNAEHTVVLGNDRDPLSGAKGDCVIFITTMPNGCLGYQKNFFDTHRHNIPLWGVLLLNEDESVHSQLNVFFRSNGLRRRIFKITSDTDYNALADELTVLASIHPRLVAIYSARPNCGRRSLMRLLSEYLPDWEFKPADKYSAQNSFSATNAGQIIFVGQTLEDISQFCSLENKSLFYVLTMPDMNVQGYLNQAHLPELMLEYGGMPESWTEALVKQHLFYISPLYENWYHTNTNPKLDDRFVMWDRFGLPCLKKDYTDEHVRDFLSQFQQCGALAQALRDTL